MPNPAVNTEPKRPIGSRPWVLVITKHLGRAQVIRHAVPAGHDLVPVANFESAVIIVRQISANHNLRLLLVDSGAITDPRDWGHLHDLYCSGTPINAPIRVLATADSYGRALHALAALGQPQPAHS